MVIELRTRLVRVVFWVVGVVYEVVHMYLIKQKWKIIILLLISL
jgi:hypothetical protein